MDVNYEVWGQPQEWQNIDSYTWANLADCKIPKTGRVTYYNAYNAGALEGGVVPTDLSLAFWGIGEGSILAHPMYLSSYWDGDVIKTTANVVQPAAPVPCILNWTVDPSGTQADMSWYYRYAPTDAPGEDTWSAGSLIATTAYSRTLIASFNYQKIILTPYVRIRKQSGSDWANGTIPLKTYIDGMTVGGDYADWNMVLGIGYQIALGEGGQGIGENRSTGNKEMGIAFPVSFEGSDSTWTGYKPSRNRNTTFTWFATEYGIDALMTNFSFDYYTHAIAPYREWNPDDFSSLHLVGDSNTGFRFKYCDNYYAGGHMYGQVPIYYYNPDDGMWELNDSTPWNTDYAHPFAYINCNTANKNEVRDYVLKQIAYLGFPFVYDPEVASRGQIGDIGVYLPKFDDNGITTGEYEEGTAALALPNAQWIDGRTGSGYDPYKPPTPSGEDDTGDLENSTYGNYGYTGGNKLYLLTQAEVDTFMSTINAYYTPASGDTPQDIQDKKDRLELDFKGSNPFNYLVGLYALPIYVGYTDGATINLGPVDTGIAARLADPSSSRHFDFGTWKITPQFNDFRDYAPYTSIELYIPLCGSVQLDPADVMGHTIKVDALFDLQTGDLTARVLRDRLESGTSTQWTMIDTVQGNLFVSIPVTADDMGNFQNRQHYIKASMISKAVNFLGGTANTVYNDAGSVAGAVAGTGGSPHLTSPFSFLTSGFNAGMGIGLGRYQLTHSPLTPYQVSTASSAIGFNMYPRAKIFIKRPKMLTGYNQSTYAHTVGNATCENTTVGNKSGLIVCSDVDLSGLQTATTARPATLEEQRMIKQALTSGVYV